MTRFRLAALIALALPVPALAAPIDCPLRDAGYSIDSPLVDVLLNPRARAAIDAAVPGVSREFPTDAPTFAAILTPRMVAGRGRVAAAEVARLDATLRAIATTPADRAARCARYDATMPKLAPPPGRPRLLVFEKINGFDHGASVPAARDSLIRLARARGWSVVATDKAGVMTPASLARFDAVIWNNVSGDVLTLSQRRAFRDYVERGGGFVGIHGSAGDPASFWDWYADTLVGARFAGHPMHPQFQAARIRVEPDAAGIGAGLPADWTLTDEWYSFRANPRASGAHVVATIDEASYQPADPGGEDLRMGGDHPIAWRRCVGRGRAFYSAIGHRAESYDDPRYRRMLEDAVRWASDRGAKGC